MEFKKYTYLVHLHSQLFPADTSTEIKVENITKSRVKEMKFSDSVIHHLKLSSPLP